MSYIGGAVFVVFPFTTYSGQGRDLRRGSSFCETRKIGILILKLGVSDIAKTAAPELRTIARVPTHRAG